MTVTALPRQRPLTHLLALIACALLLIPAATAGAAPPQIGSPAAAVIETSTGTVLYEKNGEQRRAMASTTKLMTALVARREERLGRVFRAVDYGGSPVETRLGLEGGEQISVADLIRALMLPSANDAAQTLAVRIGGSSAEFADLMNEEAERLGLDDTNFVNAIGLDAPGHRTTALDLARIGAAAHADEFLRGVVRQKRITLKSLDRPRTIINRNRLVGQNLGDGARVDGMKTGRTQQAGYALVGSATRRGVTVVSVVLGAGSEAERDADTAALLRWGSGLMVQRTLADPAQTVMNTGIHRGHEETVALVPAERVRRVVARGADVKLEPVGVPRLAEAPVVAGQEFGSARITVNGRDAGVVALVARDAVERRGLLSHLWHSVMERRLLSLLALALLMAGTLMLVQALRRRRRARVHTRPGRHPQMPAE